MFWKKSTSKSWIIDIAGQELRIYLVRERRNNQRFSISSRGLIVRIPLMTSVLEEDRIIRDALLWTERSLEKGKVNPVNFRKFSDGLNISFFDGPRIVKFLSSEVLKGDLAWRVCLKEEGILKVYGKQLISLANMKPYPRLCEKPYSVTIVTSLKNDCVHGTTN